MTGEPETKALLSWALSVLAAGEEQGRAQLVPVAGDASSRKYFRTAGLQPTRILVDSPPATEKNDAFMAVRDLLDKAGVRVPGLIASDLDRGFMILEDLGDELLLPQLNDETAAAYYRRAFDILLQLAQSGESARALPAYDETLLGEELGRLSEWFVSGLLGYSLAADERALVGALTDLLLSSALEQPSVLVHRDFHSRNLMLTADGDLAVIDFQDAVRGPVTYDLVSLLRDCYVQWPQDRVQGWALEYRDLLCENTELQLQDAEQFMRWFDFMGLQRHLKVLGTFARLYLRDGKSAYLDDLPLVLVYVRDVLSRLGGEEPACAEFSRWFTENLDPLIGEQAWSVER